MDRMDRKNAPVWEMAGRVMEEMWGSAPRRKLLEHTVLFTREQGPFPLWVYLSDEGDVLMEADLGQCPEARMEEVLEDVNQLNGVYRYIKVYMTYGGDLKACQDLLLPEDPAAAGVLLSCQLRWFGELAESCRVELAQIMENSPAPGGGTACVV